MQAFYGHELWRDSKFGINSAEQWLSLIPENSQVLKDMLMKVANGEYLNINMKMDEFVKILMNSKHRQRNDVSQFFASIRVKILENIRPHKHSNEVLKLLSLNENIPKTTLFKRSFTSVCTRREHASLLQGPLK